jgi:hypothetical protein
VLARWNSPEYFHLVKRDDSSRGGKTELATAATAVGSIGALVGMTVTGILAALPVWAAILIVVAELFMPLLVFALLKRSEKNR